MIRQRPKVPIIFSGFSFSTIVHVIPEFSSSKLLINLMKSCASSIVAIGFLPMCFITSGFERSLKNCSASSSTNFLNKSLFVESWGKGLRFISSIIFI
jgi:hypothetical protein